MECHRSFGATLALTVVGCSGSSGSTVLETELYSSVAAPFTTVEECRAAQPSPLFNCSPSITLCSNGGFVLLTSDIINEGRYELDGTHLTASLASSGDAPTTFHGELADDRLDSPELGDGWVRAELTDEERAARDETHCAPLESRTWW